MDIPPALTEYIATKHAADHPAGPPAPDEPLQLDSLGMIRLISFLESKIGIVIEDEEIVPENFETLDKIAQLIASKK